MNHKWPLTPLGSVLKERRETPTSEELESGRVKIVEKVSFNTGQLQLRVDCNTKTGMILIRPGDLVVSGINAAKGAIAVYDEAARDPVAATIHYGAYRADRGRVDLRFLWWMLRSRFFQSLLLEYVPGGIKTELRSKRLLPIPVPLPPLAEQRRVVARIEELAGQIHEARELRQQTASEVGAITKAHLNRLFGNPYESTAGTLHVETWAKIEEVVEDVADGPHVTPAYVEQGVPFITAMNITSGRVRFDNHKAITPADHIQFQKRAKAERGDVLITKDGTIGMPCFVDTDREFSFFVSVALIKPKRTALDGEYLVWAFRIPYMQKRIAAKSRGDMIRHLVLREIRDLTIPVPSLSEQRQIVAELDALQAQADLLRAVQTETAAELDALLPAILDRAFKGELV